MVLCKECCLSMKRVMSFSKNGNREFYRCPKCHYETKAKIIRTEELYLRGEGKWKK